MPVTYPTYSAQSLRILIRTTLYIRSTYVRAHRVRSFVCLMQLNSYRCIGAMSVDYDGGAYRRGGMENLNWAVGCGGIDGEIPVHFHHIVNVHSRYM